MDVINVWYRNKIFRRIFYFWFYIRFLAKQSPSADWNIINVCFCHYGHTMYFLLSVWTERRNKKEPRTRSAVEQMGFSVSGCGTRGFAAQTVLARDDTGKPHLLPTAPAIVRPTNTPPLVVADILSWQTCEAILIMISSFRIAFRKTLKTAKISYKSKGEAGCLEKKQ